MKTRRIASQGFVFPPGAGPGGVMLLLAGLRWSEYSDGYGLSKPFVGKFFRPLLSGFGCLQCVESKGFIFGVGSPVV